MKKQISIRRFTVAVDNPVVLHNGNSNDRPIAAASSSVNSSNNVFEKPLNHPGQTYCFPKRLFGKRVRSFQSVWFMSYSWLNYQPLLFVTLKPNTIEMRTYINKDPAFISTGFCNWKKAIECFEVHRVSKWNVMFNSDTEIKNRDWKKMLEEGDGNSTGISLLLPTFQEHLF